MGVSFDGVGVVVFSGDVLVKINFYWSVFVWVGVIVGDCYWDYFNVSVGVLFINFYGNVFNILFEGMDSVLILKNVFFRKND